MVRHIHAGLAMDRGGSKDAGSCLLPRGQRDHGRGAAAASTPYVAQAAGFLDQTKLTVTVQCSRGGGGFSACPTSASSWAEGDYVRVIVDYAYPYFTPLPGFVGLGDDLNLHSQSEVRFEGA